MQLARGRNYNEFLPRSSGSGHPMRDVEGALIIDNDLARLRQERGMILNETVL
jgi:hypothetical protein